MAGNQRIERSQSGTNGPTSMTATQDLIFVASTGNGGGASLGDDSETWPQRACVGAGRNPGTLVEMTLIAARR